MRNEKHALKGELEGMKRHNYQLEKKNEKLSKQVSPITRSPLLVKKEDTRLTHSTTSLILVSILVLIIGIVLGTGVNVWYSHHCVQVSWMLAFKKVPIINYGELAILRFLHIIGIILSKQLFNLNLIIVGYW